MARIVLPVAGAIISTYLGAGPAVGWAAGSAIAGVFFPPDLGNVVSEGARLNDLKITNADYGAIMPKSYGTVGGIGGTVIWAEEIEEEKITNSQEVGGKGGGGGTVTSIEYKYYGTFAVAFGEGEAVEVLRIWADSKIIYDAREDADSGGTIFDSGFTGFTFYPGSETQEVDPLIAADQGDLANANRGVCYIVFDRLPLQNFGNRLPNITAEIKFEGSASVLTDVPLNSTGLTGAPSTHDTAAVDWDSGAIYALSADYSPARWESPTAAPYTSTITLQDSLRAWLDTTVNFGAELPIISKINKIGYVMMNSVSGFNGIVAVNPSTLAVVANWSTSTPPVAQMTSVVVPTGTPGVDVEYVILSGTASTLPNNRQSFYILQVTGTENIFSSPYGEMRISYSNDGSFETDFGAATQPGGGLDAGGYLSWAVRPLTNDVQSFEVIWVSGWEGTGLAGVGGDESTDWKIIGVEAQAVGVLTDNPLGPFLTKTREFYYNLGELRGLFPDLDWPATEVGVHFQRACAFDKSDYNTFVIQLSVEELIDDTNIRYFYFGYDMTTESWIWAKPEADFSLGTEWKVKTLATGHNQHTLLNSNTYGSSFRFENNLISEFDMATGELVQTWPAVLDDPEHATYDVQARGAVFEKLARDEPSILDFNSGTREAVPVQDILDDLATRAGFETNPYLETTPAVSQGYFIGQGEAVRQSIERLGLAYKFNVIESDFGLKVKNLASPPTAVDINETDLVLKDEKMLEESRISETSMPTAYSLTFVDQDFDYQPSTVTAKVYNSGEKVTESNNVAATNLNIVMNKDEAKGLCESILETTWQERWGVEYGLSQKYLQLEPSDIVDLTASSALFNNRIASFDLGTNFQIEVQGVNSDSSTYSADSTTDGNLGFRPPTLPSANDGFHFIIDTPLLRDGDNIGSTSDQIYHSAGPFGISQWQGMLFQKSLSGSAYGTLGQFTVPAVWGSVRTTMSDTDMPFTPDEETVLTLSVVSGSLQSITDDELYTDFLNAIAVYKSNGDIEVIQFRDVVDLGNNEYEVSFILRGRRGTDYATGNNIAGATFVLLQLDGSVQAFAQPVEEINTTTYYRVIPFGQTVLEARTQTFISEGNSLKPYAPVNQTATTDATDITFTWDRRTRVNGGLQNGTGEVPLIEASEAYELDIYDTPGGSVIRTLTSTSETVDYLNADIITDFGVGPTEITIAVYQMSEAVGRGFTTIKTIEVTNV